MSSTTIAKASRVDRALERLEAAVLRLNTASATLHPSSSPGDDEELEALRAENAQLKSLNLDAAEKLSMTIERLEAALGDEADS